MGSEEIHKREQNVSWYVLPRHQDDELRHIALTIMHFALPNLKQEKLEILRQLGYSENIAMLILKYNDLEVEHLDSMPNPLITQEQMRYCYDTKYVTQYEIHKDLVLRRQRLI